MSRKVEESKYQKEQKKQMQNDTAIGELSIMLAQIQAQSDAAIGELSLILSQVMMTEGGTNNGV